MSTEQKPEMRMGAEFAAEKGWPRMLVEAIDSPDASYSMKLRTGEHIWFKGALFSGDDFVDLIEPSKYPPEISLDSVSRVTIRVSDIVWVGDGNFYI